MLMFFFFVIIRVNRLFKQTYFDLYGELKYKMIILILSYTSFLIFRSIVNILF